MEEKGTPGRPADPGGRWNSSGTSQMKLVLSRDMHDAIRADAAQRGLPVVNLVRSVLADYLEGRERAKVT